LRDGSSRRNEPSLEADAEEDSDAGSDEDSDMESNAESDELFEESFLSDKVVVSSLELKPCACML
jgi:hypothetical protein